MGGNWENFTEMGKILLFVGGRIWKNLQECGWNGIKFFNRIILNCDHQWHLKIIVKCNQGWAFDKNKERVEFNE